MHANRRIAAHALRSFSVRLFEAAGTPREISECVAQILVNADLRGHTSHGVFHTTGYLSQIDKGSLIPDALPRIIREADATVTVDARRGWGHHAAQWCMELAMMKAAKEGVASVAAHNINHIGRLGEYVEQAADAGFLSMALSGWGGRGTGFGAPYGGSTPGLSTNPIAFGVPTSDGRPLTSDFATTRFANAKVHVYALEEKELPPDCIVDKDGNPSTDPADYINGGTLLVFGGYKGSAISMMTCLFGGLAAVPDPDSHVMGGDFFMAMDPRVFPGGDVYLDHVARFLDGIRSTPPAPGFEEVLAPGDLERRAFERQSKDGIDLPIDIWTGLTEAAAKYGVKLDNDTAGTFARTVV